jgi:Asp/Glu/hydantoin racemase
LKPLRIWYQSLVEADPGSAYFVGMRERARRIARQDTTIDFVGMPAGTYAGRTPADVVVYPYLMALHHHSILDNAYTAQQQGFDVFVIGSVQDPAIDEARGLLRIPVVGYGESAMLAACMLGRKFSVLVFQHRMDQIMDMRIERLGLTERALPTVLVPASFADVTQALAEPVDLVERFEKAAVTAIAQGAEAIIPGQLYLSEAIARAGIKRIHDVPVIDALSVTIKTAEMMHDLARLGITVSRRGATNALPDDTLIEHARRMHGRGGPRDR